MLQPVDRVIVVLTVWARKMPMIIIFPSITRHFEICSVTRSCHRPVNLNVSSDATTVYYYLLFIITHILKWRACERINISMYEMTNRIGWNEPLNNKTVFHLWNIHLWKSARIHTINQSKWITNDDTAYCSANNERALSKNGELIKFMLWLAKLAHFLNYVTHTCKWALLKTLKKVNE